MVRVICWKEVDHFFVIYLDKWTRDCDVQIFAFYAIKNFLDESRRKATVCGSLQLLQQTHCL